MIAALAAAGLVALAFGSVDAEAPVASGGNVWWTQNGWVWTAQERGHGQGRKVGRGIAAGPNARLDRFVLYAGGGRIRLPGVTDARYGGGRVLALRPSRDGTKEVLIDGRVVSRVGGHRPYVRLGQINARHAVWTEGRDAVYRVVVDGRFVPGPDIYRAPQFGASVTPGGIVFFGRSGVGCGGAAIYRYAHGRTTRVLRLPGWEDFETSWYADHALYLQTVDCDSRESHLAKLPLR